MFGPSNPFMTRRLPKRFALRLVATLLAVVYAALALVGDGLHLVAHGPGAGCEAGCCVETVEAVVPLCGCNACPSEAPDGVQASAQVGSGVPAPCEAPHDDECAVCQLLATLGHGATPPSPTLSLHATPVERACQSSLLLESCAIASPVARGPPAAV